jgi:hypothetical protein
MNIRKQQPNERSKTSVLRDFARKLTHSFRPHVVIEKSDDGTYYSVVAGKSDVAIGKIWFGEGRYRANFSLSSRARSAAPEIDPKTDRSSKLVRNNSDEDSGSSKLVHLAIEDKGEFEADVFDQLLRILSSLGLKGGKKVEAESVAATPAQFAADDLAEGVRTFDAYGDGRGDYAVVRTSTIGREEVVEVVGPVTEGCRPENVLLKEGHALLGHVVDAASRKEALAEAAAFAKTEYGAVEERHGLLYLVREAREKRQWKVFRREVSAAATEVSAKTQRGAEDEAMKKAEDLDYGKPVNVNYGSAESLVEAVSDGTWNVEIKRVSAAEGVVMASSREEALRKARDAEYGEEKVVYQVGNSTLAGLDESKSSASTEEEDDQKLLAKAVVSLARKAGDGYQGGRLIGRALGVAKRVLEEASGNRHDVFLRHQVAIAKRTLTMNDEGAFVMGGMTKDEAREILKKAGYNDAKIKRIENGDVVNETSSGRMTKEERRLADAAIGVLKMSKRGAYVTGQMTKEEAVETLKKLGYDKRTIDGIVREATNDDLNPKIRKPTEREIRDTVKAHNAGKEEPVYNDAYNKGKGLGTTGGQNVINHYLSDKYGILGSGLGGPMGKRSSKKVKLADVLAYARDNKMMAETTNPFGDVVTEGDEPTIDKDAKSDLSYEKALAEADKIGANKATGLAYLAQVCSVIQGRAGAVSPKLVYDGAKKKGVSGNQLAKMKPKEIADLMWVEGVDADAIVKRKGSERPTYDSIKQLYVARHRQDDSSYYLSATISGGTITSFTPKEFAKLAVFTLNGGERRGVDVYYDGDKIVLIKDQVEFPDRTTLAVRSNKDDVVVEAHEPNEVNAEHLNLSLRQSIDDLLNTNELTENDLSDEANALIKKAERMITSENFDHDVLADLIEKILGLKELNRADLGSDTRSAIARAKQDLRLVDAQKKKG